MIRPFRRRAIRLPEHRRQEMIQQTSDFLTWALDTAADLPRIPRKRVDEGGFNRLLRRRGGRSIADRWWHRVLNAAHTPDERR